MAGRDFERYQSTNLSAVKRLIDACLATGVGHVVQASTSSVYGAEATGAEDSSTAPVSPYGVTNLAAEHLLLAHHPTFGLPLTILRYFSIYGPRRRPDMAYRIFCERLLRGEPITVFGDGGQSRSNTYVTDCVAATIAALDGPRDGATFNIGGGQEIKLLEAIAILARHLDVDPVIQHAEVRRGRSAPHRRRHHRGPSGAGLEADRRARGRPPGRGPLGPETIRRQLNTTLPCRRGGFSSGG